MRASHLDREEVQRYLHRELTPPAAAMVSDHLGRCTECRSRVAEAEQQEDRVLGLLRHVDHPTPRVDVRVLMTGRPAPGLVWGRWAAGILFVFAAGGAAYAAPGSPLPRLVEQAYAWLHDGDRLRGRDQGPPAASFDDTRAGDERNSGVAVAAGERLTITFATPSAAVLAVSLGDGAEVVTRAVGGTAAFTSDVDRLTIGSAVGVRRFEISIPRDAPRVEVWAGSRRVFSKVASEVNAAGERDAGGRYIVPLVEPRPDVPPAQR